MSYFLLLLASARDLLLALKMRSVRVRDVLSDVLDCRLFVVRLALEFHAGPDDHGPGKGKGPLRGRWGREMAHRRT